MLKSIAGIALLPLTILSAKASARELTSDDSAYRFSALPHGNYDIGIDADAFYTARIQEVRLHEGETLILSRVTLRFHGVFDCDVHFSNSSYYLRPMERPSGATGSISGTVTDDQERALGAAEVMLFARQKGKISTVSTGADGKFTFSDLAPGTDYWFRVAQLGYFEDELTGFTVEPGFDAVYGPFALQPCEPGKCLPDLKQLRVLPTCL